MQRAGSARRHRARPGRRRSVTGTPRSGRPRTPLAPGSRVARGSRPSEAACHSPGARTAGLAKSRNSGADEHSTGRARIAVGQHEAALAPRSARPPPHRHARRRRLWDQSIVVIMPASMASMAASRLPAETSCRPEHLAPLEVVPDEGLGERPVSGVAPHSGLPHVPVSVDHARHDDAARSRRSRPFRRGPPGPVRPR